MRTKHQMEQLAKTGRVFYCIGIIALGIQQLFINDFRAEILSPFPDWPHQYVLLPILTGAALILAGIIISGVFPIKPVHAKKIALYLGLFFLVVSIASHLPYILFVSPHKASRLDVWFGIGEALAYGGGAFVMAGSFSEDSFNADRKRSLEIWLEKLIPVGRIFYSILIVMFGFSHFVFTDFVSTLVPKWVGMPFFWTYFFGVALVGSGIAIIFKLWIKPIAFLQATMLFLFFMFFHIPDAIANPYASHGNEIVRAFVALLFCGISLVIASKENQ